MPTPFCAHVIDGGDEQLIIAMPANVMLKRAREQRGMSLQQVADACGINIRQYQKFESGERDFAGCAFSTGLRLCKVLCINPWGFLTPAPTRRQSRPSSAPGTSGDASASQPVSPRHVRRLV